MLLNRKLGALAACAAALLVVVGLASPAGATEKNGVLELGELGLYLNTGSTGTVFDLYFSDSNFNGEYFPGTSIPVANNTESWRNRDTYWWHVFTDANYNGSQICLQSGTSGDFSTTYADNIESAYFSSTGC
jgi:hypothetical protein